MNTRRNRWIETAITAAALLSAIQLCSAVSMPPSRSLASALLFGSSFFGMQRVYAAVGDVLMIILERRAPDGKLSA